MSPKCAAEAAKVIREGHARGDKVTFNGEPVPPGELPAAVVEALKVVIR